MKKWTLLFIYFAFTLQLLGQFNKVDSLKLKLGNTKVDSSKVDILLDIADSFGKKFSDSNLYYLKAALQISEDHKLNSIPLITSQIVRIFGRENNFGEIIHYGRRYFETFNNVNFSHENLLIADDLGYAYISIGKQDSFIYYNEYVISNANLEVENEKIVFVSALRKRASNFISAAKYDMAIIDLQNAIQHIDTTNYFQVYTVYVTIADAYTQFGDYERALDNFGIANKYVDKIDFFSPKMHILYSYSDFHLRFEKYEKSLEYALKGLNLVMKNNEPYGELVFKSILSKIYINLGKYNKSKSYLEEVVVLGTDFQMDEIVAIAKYDLGAVAISNNDFSLALNYCKKSWEFFESTSSFLHKVKVCDCISEANEGLGDYAQSLFFLRKARVFEDSTNSEEQIKKTYKLQNKFELEKKEALNKAEQENLKIIAQQKLKSKNQFIIGVILLSVFLISLVFYVLKNIQRKKESDYIAEKEKSQTKFSQDLIQSQEVERKRISRELHDSVGQDLILMKTKATLENNVEFEKIIGSTLENVRNITQNLHPFVLETFGLTAALNKLVRSVDESTSLFVSNEIEDIDGIMNKTQELNIYRIVQEALNNVIKHSDSPSVLIAAKNNGGSIEIKIQDYGKGFDRSEKSNLMNSLGMKTLKERANILKTKLIVSSDLRKGTIIQLNIPIQHG